MSPSKEAKICANCSRVFSKPEDFYKGTSRWRVCSKKSLWFNCSCGSTLVLPSGKYSWYRPAQTMSPAAAGLFNMLSSFGSLPHVSNAVIEIQEYILRRDVEVIDMAKKIRTEPFVATEILSLANSIKLNRDPGDKRRIDSVEHAIMFVGVKMVSDLVLAIGISSIESRCKIFKNDSFWKESFLVGDIAESIAEAVNYRLSKDELYIGASLCNIGKFVMSFYLPDTLDRIEARVQDPRTLCTWREAEKVLGSPDHTKLGEIGAAVWGLPAYVADLSQEHHQAKNDVVLRDHTVATKEIVALANQISHWVLLRPSRIEQDLLEKLRLFFGFSKSDLNALAANLTRRFRQAA